MPFLSLNSHEIPIRATGGSFERTALGEQGLSFNGKLQPERRSISRSFTFDTPVGTRDDGLALAGLIQGDGQYWAFDSSLYSSKGLGPVSGYTITMSATGGVTTGGGYVQVTSAQNLTYSKQQYGDYSVFVFKYTGGAWVQYAYVYDFETAGVTQYKNGTSHSPVAGDNITNWLTITDHTTFALLGKDIDGTNGNSRYDQLIIVPYAMTASMVASFRTRIAAGTPFSPLPLLFVGGDVIPDEQQLFAGSVATGGFEMATVASGDSIGMTVTFSLTEYAGRIP